MKMSAIRRDPDLYKQADESLKAIGYTEHSFAHCTKVAKVAGDLLED